MSQRVIFWGHRDPVEFRDAANWLEVHCDCRFVPAGTVPLLGDWAPDWVIVAQQRPGEFQHDEVERLMLRFPLAAWIALLGSWCEGETRTGRPLPGVQRVFWHQWQPRLARFLLGQSADSPQRMPRTASEAEITMAGLAGPQAILRSAAGDRPLTSLRIRPTALVRCGNARWTVFRELLAEWGLLVRRVDCDRTTRIDIEPPQATSALYYLCDTGPGLDCDREDFAADLRRFQPLGAIAIVDFPRWQERLAWSRAGADHVLSTTMADR